MRFEDEIKVTELHHHDQRIFGELNYIYDRQIEKDVTCK